MRSQPEHTWRADLAACRDLLRRHALDPFRTSVAIANCLYGVQLLFSEDLGAGFAKALNDWMAAEWLDKEPRLRASIVIPVQNPEMAVDEINRVAADKRFVQILMLVMGDMPLGKRHYWPIYAAAERNDLEPPAIGITQAIADVIRAIAALPGCRLARMSGSGSACFGLFDSEGGAAAALRDLTEAQPRWWARASSIGG